MEVFAPLQDTRTRDTLDDAQTRQPCDETVLQSIADDDETDFPDSSSVYSQDSVLTAVHRPVVDRRHTPLDFMSQRQSAVETEEESLTPRQLSELSSTEALLQARTLQHSPILRPVSYIPNTETAQTYSSSEASQNSQNNRGSQASTLTVDSHFNARLRVHNARSSRAYESRMDANTRRIRALERQQDMPERGGASFASADVRRFEEMQARSIARSAKPAAQPDNHNSQNQETASTASVASSSTSQHDRYSTVSDAPSITSASTTESRRSQALSFTSVASSDRSATSKHARRPRVEATAPDTAPAPPHPARDATRFPHLDPVMESPIVSPALRASATSPAVSSTSRSRKSSLPSRRDSAQQGTEVAAPPELPSLKVRRRRAVANLSHIPVSQAYPQPLRFSTMKSPSPATAPPLPSNNTVVRSTSRLITDIGNELNREMEDVLSPRSAAFIPRPESPDENDVETPTRRPLRQVRSMRSMGFKAPSVPAPNKPLPSIPGPIARSEAPRGVAANAFIDVEFGPGPAVSRAPSSLPPQPAPPPTGPLPRPPIPVAVPAIPVIPSTPSSPSSPSVSGSSSSFVTRADFSVKKERSVRPATSVAAFSHRPTPTSVDQPQPERPVRRLESAANQQKPARARLLGKMVSMAELKNRREAGSGGSGEDVAVGMRTFLEEDGGAGGDGGVVPASTKEKAVEGGNKKKFFGGLFRRKGKEGEK